MKKYTYISKIFLLTALAALPFSTHAAPDITNTSGPFTHGQSVTVSGSGFGVKSPVAPYFYDNFESGSAGANLAGNNGTVGSAVWEWYIGAGQIPFITYHIEQHYGQGSKSVSAGVITDDLFRNLGIRGLNGQSAYYTLKYRWHSAAWPDATDAIYKPLRICAQRSESTDDMYSGDPRLYLQAGASNNWWYIAVRDSAGGYPDGVQTTTVEPSLDTWHRDEAYFKLGASSDAVARYWMDSDLLMDKSGFTTGTDYPIGSFLLPFEMAQNGASFAYTVWADDVYFDNTQARVEICSGATWAARGTCEIQIPHTTWGDSSLQITVNQGALTGTNYLYVVDANGDANASGEEITFGAGGGDTTAPSAPAGLSVV